jgi:hypothetical protein
LLSVKRFACPLCTYLLLVADLGWSCLLLPLFCLPCAVFCAAYNKLDAHGKQWSDPTVFDAPLTAKGRQQVRMAVVGRPWQAHACCLQEVCWYLLWC